MPLQYDPAFYESAKGLLGMIAARPPPKDHDVESRRVGLAGFLAAIAAATPSVPGIQQTKYETTSPDGHTVAIYRFTQGPPQSSGPPAPAVVHFHGGGMIIGTVDMFINSLERKVYESGVQFFSIEYRLSPENPYPIPIDDCYAGLKWVNEHATELSVDPSRIAVMGESAGGGLAAGVALMARDRQLSPPLAKQILVYPMIDATNVKPVSPDLAKHLFWTVGSNVTGWSAYLGRTVDGSSDGIPSYASPTLAESVGGLPPTYIDVGGLDLFIEENVDYANRLMKANTTVEFHVYPGLPHAFESLGGVESAAYLLAQANRIRAIQSF